MALSILGTEQWSAGAGTRGLTIPAGTDALVVLSSAESGMVGTPASLGGEALTAAATIDDSSDDSQIAYLLDISGRASDTLTVSGGSGTTHTAIYLSGNTVGLLGADNPTGGCGTKTKTYTADAGGGDSIGFYVGHIGFTSDISTYAGMTTVYGPAQSDNVYREQGYKVAAGGVDVTVGIVFNCGLPGSSGVWFTLGLYEADPGVRFEPTAFGAEVGITSGEYGFEFVVGADVYLIQQRLGVEAGFTAGLAFRTSGRRQVMLTGSGIETPEMTTGGTTGQVLVFNTAGVPTWEDSAGSVSTLDDVGDVDAAAPDDGDVLVWNDYLQAWVAEAPSAGTSDLSTLEIDLAVSGAHTVDRDTAATHDLTLTGDATLTPDHSDPTAGDAIDLRILIRQDGTGGRTLAWGGSITWAGGSAPTMPTAADALLTVGLLSVDDGTTWLGYAADSSDVGALDDLTDVEAAAPSDGDLLRWSDYLAAWVTVEPSAIGRWEPVVHDPDGYGPELVFDDGDIVMHFIND